MTKNRSFDFMIRDQADLIDFAVSFKYLLLKGEHKKGKEQIIEKRHREKEVKQFVKQLKIFKMKFKISYQALLENKTILELFLSRIL
jgi:hypothetical protein